MFGFIFIALLVVEAFLLAKYLKALTNVSSISSEQQMKLGLTILESNLTNYILLKDIKFFICLLTKSYAKTDVDDDLKYMLDQARKYLLLQYPVVILLFFVPTIFK